MTLHLSLCLISWFRYCCRSSVKSYQKSARQSPLLFLHSRDFKIISVSEEKHLAQVRRSVLTITLVFEEFSKVKKIAVLLRLRLIWARIAGGILVSLLESFKEKRLFGVGSVRRVCFGRFEQVALRRRHGHDSVFGRLGLDDLQVRVSLNVLNFLQQRVFRVFSLDDYFLFGKRLRVPARQLSEGDFAGPESLTEAFHFSRVLRALEVFENLEILEGF